MLNSYPYLTLRNHTYYARIHIPNHLSEIAGRKNFFYSLRTNDYAQAIRAVKLGLKVKAISQISYELGRFAMILFNACHDTSVKRIGCRIDTFTIGRQ